MPEPGSLYEQRASTISKLESALRAIDETSQKKAEQEAKKQQAREKMPT